jgi:shikimate dehydrogenase
MISYGLIGYPLQHSFSKKYFTEKLENEGSKDIQFELFPLQSIIELKDVLRSHKNLKGLAVTIPYKELVIPFLSEYDEVVQNVRAVNCIKIRDGVLSGFNTDIIGFEKSFKPCLREHHSQALVLGNGGASKAVQYVLKKLNIPFLVVTRDLILQTHHINYEMIDRIIIENYRVIINCTPVGMYPNENEKPAIPYQYLSQQHFVYDLIYKPDETLFLKEAKKQGALIKNGFEMLMIQAEENWRIWNEV